MWKLVLMHFKGEGEFSDLDVSFVSDGSIYIPTPQKEVWGPVLVLKFPYRIVCVSQLNTFVQHLNACRRCSTSACSGIIVPSSVKKSKLGGAVMINFSCSGCLMHHILFQSSMKFGGTTKVGVRGGWSCVTEVT